MRERTLALAGIFQAAGLVRRIATHGRSEPTAMATSIGSIFRLDAETTEAVYDLNPQTYQAEKEEHGGLDRGLRMLTQTLDPDLLRYVVALIYLERRFSRNSRIKNELSDGIRRIQRQADYLGLTHTNVLAALADLYRNTISTLGYRIIVHGKPEYLTQEHQVVSIRALLLAGLRSSVLYHQLGGRRWRLIVNRRSTVDTAKAILQLHNE